MERLQKIMAHAGIDSRRHCEDLIRQGLVKVNGQVVTKIPTLVDPQKDIITIGRKRLKYEPLAYYVLNKPKKVVCTNNDPAGRKRAIDCLKGVKERVYPIGRLDADSTGLVLLSNDGELANLLTHPRYGIAKTYVAEIGEWIVDEDIDKLRNGMYLDGKKARVARVKILRRGPQRSRLEIVLTQGHNRQIRRMLARLGHSVRSLSRVKIGPITTRGIGSGKFRKLTPQEVKSLKKMVTEQALRVKNKSKGMATKAAGKSKFVSGSIKATTSDSKRTKNTKGTRKTVSKSLSKTHEIGIKKTKKVAKTPAKSIKTSPKKRAKKQINTAKRGKK